MEIAGHGWLIINFVNVTRRLTKTQKSEQKVESYGLGSAGFTAMIETRCQEREKQFEKLLRRVIDYKLHPASVRLNRRFLRREKKNKAPAVWAEWK